MFLKILLPAGCFLVIAFGLASIFVFGEPTPNGADNQVLVASPTTVPLEPDSVSSATTISRVQARPDIGSAFFRRAVASPQTETVANSNSIAATPSFIPTAPGLDIATDILLSQIISPTNTIPESVTVDETILGPVADTTTTTTFKRVEVTEASTTTSASATTIDTTTSLLTNSTASEEAETTSSNLVDTTSPSTTEAPSTSTTATTTTTTEPETEPVVFNMLTGTNVLPGNHNCTLYSRNDESVQFEGAHFEPTIVLEDSYTFNWGWEDEPFEENSLSFTTPEWPFEHVAIQVATASLEVAQVTCVPAE